MLYYKIVLANHTPLNEIVEEEKQSLDEPMPLIEAKGAT